MTLAKLVIPNHSFTNNAGSQYLILTKDTKFIIILSQLSINLVKCNLYWVNTLFTFGLIVILYLKFLFINF